MRDRDLSLDDDDWIGEDSDDDGADVVPCPSCGVELYDDAEQCPNCGEYVVHRSNVWHGKPWWWVILGLAGVIAVLWLSMP
jgi:predicted RNA-binding Zn-ribbon protein involved in translation (DUF1610 family)